MRSVFGTQFPGKFPEATQRRRIAPSRAILEGNSMGRRRERHKQADPTATRIAAALEMIRVANEHWHGLAVWLSRSGMAQDAELLDRLAERMARDERFRAEASRRRGRRRQGFSLNSLWPGGANYRICRLGYFTNRPVADACQFR
jgi:hypothetical protein